MIRVNDLSKSFGTTQVLDRLTFTLDRPTVLMGQSGVGKTTLLRILMELESPTEGTVEREGRLGAVFQEDRLVPSLSPGENIRLTACREISRRELEAAFEAVGLEPTAQQLPCKALSGGQKRRVALLRALLSGADWLLLDEPFTGLDEDTLEQTVAFTKAQVGQRPCLLVCHDPAAVQALGWPVMTLE